MGLITDRPWIICCTRADLDEVPQPPYLHKCGCPLAQLITKSQEKTATLLGFDETDVGGTLGTSPKKYKEITLSGTITGDPQWNGACCTRLDFTYSGVFSYQYAFSATSGPPFFPTESIDIEILSTTNPLPECPGGLVSFPGCPGSTSTTSTSDLHGPSVPGLWSAAPTKTLTSEDTEDDALARATASAGTVSGTLWEIRSDDFSFTKRTSSYALKASGLQIDARYTARVEIERRPAIKNPAGSGYVDENGDPSEWETTDDEAAEMIDEYTFTATAAEMLVPTTGTWSDDNTDDVIDDSEVTPSIEIPHVQGWEYRIKTVRIELALTAA